MIIKKWLCICIMLGVQHIAWAEATLVNAIAFENGSVLLSYTSEYGDRASAEWIALGLVDGTAEIGWASKKFSTYPHEFIFELATLYDIHQLNFDNSKTSEKKYPGISARKVMVQASIEGKQGVYQTIFSGELDPTGISSFTLENTAQARWLKLIIESNGGDSKYTELMEFEAMGLEVEPRGKTDTLSSTYKTNWNSFFMLIDGSDLQGCYDHDGGVFSGSSNGNFLNIEWREYGPQIGKAVMAITQDGATFNGFWYENGVLKGTWFGTRVDDSLQPKCAKGLKQNESSQVENALNETGRAVLYGIYFDHDSDVLEAESLATLQDILQWLHANPEKMVIFEGHTDSDGANQYNLDLSSRRAAAVVSWMNQNKVDPVRLQSMGFGETKSVADNNSFQGKALNRRVEIRVK
jgi:outer membrane protein OmpA-like peptidoglycan-associated protein